MRIKHIRKVSSNKPLELCSYCHEHALDESTPLQNLSYFEERNQQLEQKVRELENQIQMIFQNCGVLKALENLYKEYSCKYNKLWEPRKKENIRDFPHLLTVTYDPSKFKNLYNLEAQRDYMLFVLGLAHQKNLIESSELCFEKQKNGNLHCHLIADFKKPEKVKEFLVPFFTKKTLENQYAIDIVLNWVPNQYEKPMDYIKKPETKDTGLYNNFYFI